MKTFMKLFKKQKIIRWLATTPFLESICARISELIVYAKYNNPEQSKIIELIRKIKKENELLLTYTEAFTLFSLVKQTSKISGDIAEVGCYRGGLRK